MMLSLPSVVLAENAGLLFATPPCGGPVCDWATQVFDGKECLPNEAARASAFDALAATPHIWYDLEHGTCRVYSASSDSLNFTIEATDGILFAAAPHRAILALNDRAKFSDLAVFEGHQTAVALHRPGQPTTLYLGKMTNGILVGEKLADGGGGGDEFEAACSFLSVEQQAALSGVAVGQCTYDGMGGVSVTSPELLYVFNQEGLKPPHDFSLFVGKNAATYDQDGNYEVFTITDGGAAHVSGHVYFSTRLGTWQTELSRGQASVTEPCTVFVDPTCPGIFRRC